jgi:Fic family protein
MSSQIEGTQSSLQDVLAAEAKLLASDRPQDVDEVVNYVATMNYGLERLASLPVSVRLTRARFLLTWANSSVSSTKNPSFQSF